MDKHLDELCNSLAMKDISRREALQKFGSGLAGVLLACSGFGSAREAVAQGTCGANKDYLAVGSFNTSSLLIYDSVTGALLGQFDPNNLANLKTPSAGLFGPDGNLYVSSGIFSKHHHVVLQYDGKTGEFLQVFARRNITSPRGLLFGPDGHLYVANGNDAASDDPASVERFDGKTGKFLDYFVAPAGGGLEHPSFMVFGPDGGNDGKLDLYISSAHGGSILRYDGATGAFKGVFVAAASGGLDAPMGMAFGPDGNLYVASSNWFDGSNGPFYTGQFPPGAILVYEGPSGSNPGAFLGTFITSGYGGLYNPVGLLFGPHGDLYVSSCVQSGKGKLRAEPNTSVVLRYNGRTGAFKSVFVAPDSGGLSFPACIAFGKTNPETLNYRNDNNF